MSNTPSEDPEAIPLVDEEMEAIANMIEEAERHGLLTEVIWSYGNVIDDCVTVAQACAVALDEWDI